MVSWVTTTSSLRQENTVWPITKLSLTQSSERCSLRRLNLIQTFLKVQCSQSQQPESVMDESYMSQLYQWCSASMQGPRFNPYLVCTHTQARINTHRWEGRENLKRRELHTKKECQREIKALDESTNVVNISELSGQSLWFQFLLKSLCCFHKRARNYWESSNYIEAI